MSLFEILLLLSFLSLNPDSFQLDLLFLPKNALFLFSLTDDLLIFLMAALFFELALTLLFLLIHATESNVLFLNQLFDSNGLLLFNLSHARALLLLHSRSELSFFYFKTKFCTLFLTLNPFNALLLFDDKATTALFIFTQPALAKFPFLLIDPCTASLVLLDALQSLLVFDANAFLPLVLVFIQSTLTILLFNLAPQSVLFELCIALLFSLLGSEGHLLRSFFMELLTLSLFLLLSFLVVSLEALKAEPVFFCVALSLQAQLLFKLALVKLSQLGHSPCITLFCFTPQLIFFLVKGFLSRSFFSFVLCPLFIVLRHKLSLAGSLLLQNLVPRLFFFPHDAESDLFLFFQPLRFFLLLKAEL